MSKTTYTTIFAHDSRKSYSLNGHTTFYKDCVVISEDGINFIEFETGHYTVYVEDAKSFNLTKDEYMNSDLRLTDKEYLKKYANPRLYEICEYLFECNEIDGCNEMDEHYFKDLPKWDYPNLYLICDDSGEFKGNKCIAQIFLIKERVFVCYTRRGYQWGSWCYVSSLPVESEVKVNQKGDIEYKFKVHVDDVGYIQLPVCKELIDIFHNKLKQ